MSGADVRVDGHMIEVNARVVVNAAGPWIDDVRRLESPQAGTSVLLDKGVHVLVPASGEEWSAAVTIPQDRVRVTFAVPWYGMLLLGTTESVYEGDPSDVSVEPREIEQILDEAAVAVDPSLVAPERVRATYAGLRVLPVGSSETVSARRETVITLGRGGMLSVAGGKLTTYRRIALSVLDRLRSDLGVHRVNRRPWPLPGVAATSVPFPLELEPAIRMHLLHLYGGLATDVVAPGVADPTLLEPLHEGGPDIAAQALYASTAEWALSAGDVIRRRTTLFYRGLDEPGVARRVEDLLDRAVRP